MKKISLLTCTALVMSNMIGTGVFTSLGFQLVDIRSGFAIVLLWVLGGLLALCGAFSYAELGSALPRSGGEYNFLSRIYHPSIGFMAGLLSVMVAFPAPAALAALAFAKYFQDLFPGTNAQFSACFIVASLSIAHLFSLSLASKTQNTFLTFNSTLILLFIIAGTRATPAGNISFTPSYADFSTILSAPFAVSLMYVMYSYSGWNASSYILGEIDDIERSGANSLILGTLLTTFLYVGLNTVFLYTTPINLMLGKVDVAHVSAVQIFGSGGSRIMSLLICTALMGFISSMLWIGPRVAQTMGEDIPLLRIFSRQNSKGIPIIASSLQLAMVYFFLLSSSFESALLYTQFTLLLSSTICVLGVIVLRWREPHLPRRFSCPGYPFTPLIFSCISLFSLVKTFSLKPYESFAGLLTALVFLLLYFFLRRFSCKDALLDS